MSEISQLDFISHLSLMNSEKLHCSLGHSIKLSQVVSREPSQQLMLIEPLLCTRPCTKHFTRTFHFILIKIQVCYYLYFRLGNLRLKEIK